jgi:hypothetical protein
VNCIVFLISFSDCSLIVYRNVTDFCVLFLYPLLMRTKHVMNMLMRSKVFCLGSFYYLFFIIIFCTGAHWLFLIAATLWHWISLPPSFTFILLPHSSPLFLPCFSRSQFSIFIHEYIIFPLHSLSSFSLYPPPPPGTSLRQDLFYLPVLHFWKKIFLFV